MQQKEQNPQKTASHKEQPEKKKKRKNWKESEKNNPNPCRQGERDGGCC